MHTGVAVHTSVSVIFVLRETALSDCQEGALAV